MLGSGNLAINASRIPLVSALVLAVVLSLGNTGADEDRLLSVRHLPERTIAEVGRTRVIAFRVAAPPSIDAVLPAVVSLPQHLEIVRPPEVLAGETIGYVRIRGSSPGETRLSVGNASLLVRVVEVRGRRTERTGPRIVGPSSGAVIWGRVAIGVEIAEPAPRPARRFVVRLGSGRTLEPIRESVTRYPVLRHVFFEIDAQAEAEGPLEMTPVAIDADGGEESGESACVRILHPRPGALHEGEAEILYDVERPPRFRSPLLSEGRDARASGGKFFVNASAYPALCFPVVVAEPGWYQLVLVAAGTRAQGVLPTVGVVVDGAPAWVTNGGLLDETWHRLSVGVPFHLDAGTRVITPFFVNDFYVPFRCDRNLYVDCFEIARVAEARPSVVSLASDTSGATEPDRAELGAMGAMAAGMAVSSVNPGPQRRPRFADPYGLRAVPLRVGWIRPWDGQIIPGLVEIEGRCGWENRDSVPAPDVTLTINGCHEFSQRSAAPTFWVDPHAFTSGPNRLQLTATRENGEVAVAPAQTLHWPEDAAVHKAMALRRHLRFSIHDPRWDASIQDRLENKHYPKELRAACFYSEGSISLALPESLAGSFDVYLDVLGEHYRGAPIASVALRTPDTEQPVGEVEGPTWWHFVKVGTVQLSAGRKSLVVAFLNDAYDEGQGDRNLFLQALTLAERPVEEDRVAPIVWVRYPPPGQRMALADAVVAQASDNVSLASAELVFDGIRSGISISLNRKPGRFVLPLLLRAVEAGEHTVAVRATDVAGHSILSEATRVVVVSQRSPSLTPYARAVHLLQRFAYGPDPEELAFLLTAGEEAWLSDRLDRTLDDSGDLAALGSYFSSLLRRDPYSVPRRAVAHQILTPNPVLGRFILWVQNHFSTWVLKTDGDRKWKEYVTFARLGAAPFDRLLRASAESPAMLNYLDQESSFVGRMNENYAREIMELHTLGVDGGYTQTDVTRLATLLTGCTVSLQGDGQGGGDDARTYTFRFDPKLNDGREVKILGMRFEAADRSGEGPAGFTDRCDRVRLALETLVAHPSTAAFLSRKLAEHYTTVPAPAELVNDLTQVFRESHGSTKALLKAIARHPAFWAARAGRVASPLDYGIRLARICRHHHPWLVSDYLERSGQGLFDRPTPDGYPEEDAADSNGQVQRWRLPRDLQWDLAALVPDPWRYSQAIPNHDWEQRVIDVLAVRLTGGVLGDSSNAAAMRVLRDRPGTREERVREVGILIAQLPEASLR